MMINREIRLRERPVDRARIDDFAAVDCEIPPLAADEVLVEVRWLSIEPYQNERVQGDQLGPRVAVGARMVGRGIGRVVAGCLPANTLVTGELGWQRYAVVKASTMAVLPTDLPRETLALSVLGVPGLTAWLAIFEVARTRASEVMVVTSAAGTVGSIAGQLASRAGIRTIGITAGSAKCTALRDMGYDMALDRDASMPIAEVIRAACGARGGFDTFLDLAGGPLLASCLPAGNVGARIVLCGRIGAYGAAPCTLDVDVVLYRRLHVQGFLVHDHANRMAEARASLLQAVRDDGLRVHETMYDGLDSAPAALAALLRGQGMGKHLVRVVA